MYAHQVIEDLKNITVLPQYPDYSAAVSLVMYNLKNAVSFHLGDMDRAIKNNSFFKPAQGEPLFFDNCNLENLPYQSICVDWVYNSPTNESTKGLIWVSEYGSGEARFLQIFNFSHVYPGYNGAVGKAWELSPRIYTIQTTRGGLQYQDLIDLNPGGHIQFELTMLDRFLKLVNCKNITTIDNPPPEKLNKKRAKSGKCPLFTYKTLVIKPTGKKQAQNEAQGLWENRVHLCRGHFKTYTEENPLFGRLTGRYWWQPSVRGNKKKGVVMKDYEVRG